MTGLKTCLSFVPQTEAKPEIRAGHAPSLDFFSGCLISPRAQCFRQSQQFESLCSETDQ